MYIYSFLGGLLLGTVILFVPVLWGGFFLGGSTIIYLLEFIPFYTNSVDVQGLLILLTTYYLLLSVIWSIILLSLRNRLKLNILKFIFNFIAGLIGILMPTYIMYYGLMHITFGF